MKFPNKKYSKLLDYKKDYYNFLKEAYDSIDNIKLNKTIHILEKAYKNPKIKVFVCGNGGSAALANHFACDHQKILNETKILKPFLISLSSSNNAVRVAKCASLLERSGRNQIWNICSERPKLASGLV